MNDDLTPGERAAMRARIVGGASGIKPVGAHRNAAIAGSIAAVLVVAIAGGVAATSTLSAPPVTSTVSPTATLLPMPTPDASSPTPSPTPTPAETPAAVARTAFDGDCDQVLDAQTVSTIVGAEMVPAVRGTVYDPAVLGGITCAWGATSDSYRGVAVTVFPAEVVPDSVMTTFGVPSDCAFSGLSCETAGRFGDAVVSVRGSTDDEIAALLAAVGERAAERAGTPRALAGDAWQVPDCASVLEAAEAARGRGDIGPHRGDYLPTGLQWEVMSANDAAGFCALDNLSAVDTATVVDIWLGPGSSPESAEIDGQGGVPSSVTGAEAAWFIPGREYTAQRLIVRSGGNTLLVQTASMTEEEMIRVAEGLVRVLG
jgi:hypothetical protein